MKITQEVEVKPVKGYKKKVTTIICDICKQPAKDTSTHPRITKCYLCKRDIHYGYDSIGKCSDYDDDMTDYPPYYCIICYRLRFMGDYLEEINNLDEEYYNKKEAIDKKIIAESLQLKA